MRWNKNAQFVSEEKIKKKKEKREDYIVFRMK